MRHPSSTDLPLSCSLSLPHSLQVGHWWHRPADVIPKSKSHYIYQAWMWCWKRCDTIAAMFGPYFWKEEHHGSSTCSHSVTWCWPHFFLDVLQWLNISCTSPWISVWVEKKDRCWWSNETAVLQEPGATCARAAREWVMKWQHSNVDLADSARYNLKDIAVYSEDHLQPRNKDAILLAQCDFCCTDWL